MQNDPLHDTPSSALLRSAPFKKLVTNRWQVSLILTFAMLVVYVGFILAVAFHKDWLSHKIGMHVSVGLPIGIGIIVFAWLLTGIYVLWANKRYDLQVNALKNQLKK